MEDLFFQQPVECFRTCIVFHCEYSQKRGPKLCRLFRKIDRGIHGVDRFPNLFYPELYLMQGGYRAFFSEFPDLCMPMGYIPMTHPDFREQLRHEGSLERRFWKSYQRKTQPKLHTRRRVM